MIAAVCAATVFWISAAPQVNGQDPAPPGDGAPKAGGRGGRGGKGGPKAPAVPAGPVRRLPNGKPDIQGYWNAGGGGLFSIEATDQRKQIGVNAGKGVVTDPADGKIPYQPWAREKEIDLSENHTIEESDAHCYTSGIPHMVEAQSSFQILQPEGPAGYVVMIWEYMHNYRMIPTDNRPHVLPASVHPVRRAIRRALGRRTRWWWTIPIKMRGLGTTSQRTSTATRSTWWSALRPRTKI